MSGIASILRRDRHDAMTAMLHEIARGHRDQGIVDVLRIVKATADKRKTHVGAPDDSHGAPLATTLPWDDEPTARRRAAQLIRRIARSRARRRAIDEAERGGPDPIWSFEAHAVVLDQWEDAGIAPAAVVEALRRSREGRKDAGLPPGDPAPRHTGGLVRMTSHSFGGGLRAWDEDGAAVGIAHRAPETLVAAMVGRTLGEIISHHALKRAGTTVVKAASLEDGWLTLRLEPDYHPLEPIPADVDQTWRSIEYGD